MKDYCQLSAVKCIFFLFSHTVSIRLYVYARVYNPDSCKAHLLSVLTATKNEKLVKIFVHATLASRSINKLQKMPAGAIS